MLDYYKNLIPKLQKASKFNCWSFSSGTSRNFQVFFQAFCKAIMRLSFSFIKPNSPTRVRTTNVLIKLKEFTGRTCDKWSKEWKTHLEYQRQSLVHVAHSRRDERVCRDDDKGGEGEESRTQVGCIEFLVLATHPHETHIWEMHQHPRAHEGEPTEIYHYHC